jgi:hypothetical protein
MNQLLHILTFSPRLTAAVGIMLFGGIGGIASQSEDAPKKHANAWSKDSSASVYDAQKRADDGWGSGTKTGNSRDNRRGSGRTTQEVWVDRDGVIHEKEDMKAIDPDAYQ